MQRERDLQAEIILALSQRGAVPLRINSGLLLTPHGTRVRAAPEGMSDLLVLYQGKTFFLEVKTGTKQNVAQKRFQAMCETQFINYSVVRSVEDAVAVVTKG